jgi:ribosomal protein S18 acetylase RimI-like enzyme
MAQVRKMLASEAGGVLRLWNENCREAGNRSLSDDAAGRVLAALQKYASHTEAFCLVAEEGSGLVGFLTARITTHPILEGIAGEIEVLYVHPEVRRRGIGAALVKEAVKLLQLSGTGTIRVYACAESQVARNFWQYLGWEQDLTVFSSYEGGR